MARLSLGMRVPSAVSSAYRAESASAPLDPSPYPAGTPISWLICTGVRTPVARRNSSSTCCAMPGCTTSWPASSTVVVTPLCMEKPAPTDPVSAADPDSSTPKKPVTCAGQKAAPLMSAGLNCRQNIRIWLKPIIPV